MRKSIRATTVMQRMLESKRKDRMIFRYAVFTNEKVEVLKQVVGGQLAQKPRGMIIRPGN